MGSSNRIASEQHGRLQTLFNTSPEAIILHDAQGTIHDVNVQTVENLEYTREQLLSMGISEIDAAYDQEELATLWTGIGYGEQETIEGRHRRADGSTFPVEVSIRKIDLDGEKRLLTLSRDITEQKRREQELKELSEEYEAIFDNAQDAIFLINVATPDSEPVFRFERLNPSHESTTGLFTENIQGKTPREVLGDEAGAEVEANYRRCVNAREPITYEEELPMPDGSRIWETKLAPIIVDDEITRIVGAAREITDRKERERRYNAIFNQTYQFTGLMEPDGTVLEANETALEVGDLDREEVVGEKLWDAYWFQDSGRTSEQVRDAVRRAADGEFVRLDCPVQGADEELVIDFSIRPITEEDGEVTLLIPEGLDITDRKEREQELQRFRQAANAAGHVVYLTDRDGIIEYVNPAFESVTGYSADEAVGSRPRILQSGEMPDDVYEDLWSTLLNGNVWEGELIDQRKNGEQYTARQTIGPIKADDEIDGFVAIQTDISEQKALEADLETSLTQLNIMDRVLRHNLRNEMNVITGNAETIQATSEGDVAEMAEIITETSEKLLTTVDKQREIVDELVDEQSPELIDLGAVIDATVAATRKQYPEVHITVEGTADRQVRAIESINRALTELLTNAAIHSDQTEPSIEATVEDRDDTVAVRIADDGPGIPEMERNIITEDAEIDPLYHGSGLGLWLVKMIVEKSGGSLAFDENEPRGSIVTISFPMAPAGGTE